MRSLSRRGEMNKVEPRSAGRFEELGIGSKEYAKLLSVFAEFDINSDGKLDLDEFLTTMDMKSRFVVYQR